MRRQLYILIFSIEEMEGNHNQIGLPKLVLQYLKFFTQHDSFRRYKPAVINRNDKCFDRRMSHYNEKLLNQLLLLQLNPHHIDYAHSFPDLQSYSSCYLANDRELYEVR